MSKLFDFEQHYNENYLKANTYAKFLVCYPMQLNKILSNILMQLYTHSFLIVWIYLAKTYPLLGFGSLFFVILGKIIPNILVISFLS